MRKLLFLLLLGLFWGGVSQTYYGLRYRTPAVTTLAETPAGSLPAYVNLKKLTFSLTDAMVGKGLGDGMVFVPVRGQGESAKGEYKVIVRIKDPELAAAMVSEKPGPEIAQKALALAARTEATGMVETWVNSKDVKSFRKAVPSVSEDVVLIKEGEEPALGGGLAMLVLGIGIVVYLVKRAAKQEGPTPPPVPTAPVG